ncbi:MAG: PQQ-binding-like beta-propeller repeat protein [Verrucomicrobiales bacterium]
MLVFISAAPMAALAADPSHPSPGETWPGLMFHAAPRPLPGGAVTSDWPRLLGDRHVPISAETKLRSDFPAEGPPLVWEAAKGTGYAGPAIVGDRLVLFHRVDDRETIDCLHAETGRRFWSHSYPIEYRDRFGYSDGPRASPVIADGRVFTFGVTSVLSCLDLQSGTLHWRRECGKEDGVPQFFFGSGATPLVQGDFLVCDLGGSGGKDVVGFDVATGAVKWFAKTGWSQSYSSPIPAVLHGQSRVLFFQGGEGDESMDSQGGLVSIDPANGTVHGKFFWRARRHTSVNAAAPVLCSPHRVLVTQAYIDPDSSSNGAALVEVLEDGSFHLAWKNEDLACHWMTPVFHDGHLYAFSGEKERAAELVCHRADTGQRLWQTKLSHDITLPPSQGGRPLTIGFMRGSLLHADGRFLALGEWGTLAWLTLSPQGAQKHATAQLFAAPGGAWTLPALSRGLLYVCQNEKDELTGASRRLLCYDFRGQ